MCLRSGGGALILIALPMLVMAGLLVWLEVSGIAAQGNNPPPSFLLPGIAAVLAAVAVIFLFGRSECTLDKQRGLMLRRRSLLGIGVTQETPLETLRQVTITREIRRSNKSTYTVFPVRLEGVERPVKVREPRQYDPARGLAEELAKFLQVPLADSSTGETVVREAAWLDESLRDRLRRTGEVVQVLPEPGRTRARLLRKENMYRVETVPSGVAAAVSVLLPAAGVLVAVGIAFFVGRQMVHDGAPAWVPLIFAAVFALPILAILLKIGRNMSAGMSVTVSPEKVLIEKVSGSRRTALADLPMDELEEL
jgi:hypothetical protein